MTIKNQKHTFYILRDKKTGCYHLDGYREIYDNLFMARLYRDEGAAKSAIKKMKPSSWLEHNVDGYPLGMKTHDPYYPEWEIVKLDSVWNEV